MRRLAAASVEGGEAPSVEGGKLGGVELGDWTIGGWEGLAH